MVQAPSPPIPAMNTRPGLLFADVAGTLGPLADLAGTWIGFNPISLPDFDPRPPNTGPKPQYTQTVILNFLGVNWPHIGVATLTKQ